MRSGDPFGDRSWATFEAGSALSVKPFNAFTVDPRRLSPPSSRCILEAMKPPAWREKRLLTLATCRAIADDPTTSPARLAEARRRINRVLDQLAAEDAPKVIGGGFRVGRRG